jgi:uncharacterized protein
LTTGQALPNVETREGQEQLKAMGIKPLPSPDEVTRPYWEAARNHELRIQRCTNCHEFQHPPLAACEQCGGSSFEWPKLSGRAFVYTFIVDRRLMVPGFDEPYVVAQVNPVEATRDTVRITTNMRNCPLDEVYIGMPVQVVFEDVNDEVTLPQFEPASDARMR